MGQIRWTEKASSHLRAIHEYYSFPDDLLNILKDDLTTVPVKEETLAIH